MTTLSRPGGELGRELRAAYAFVERNAHLIKRYWAWEMVWLAYSVVNALAVTLIGKASGEITGVAMTAAQINTFILFLMVGTLVWHPQYQHIDRQNGTCRYSPSGTLGSARW